MPDDIERKLVDKRVAQRYLKKGRLDEKEYDRYLKALPDVSEQAVPVESNLDADDLVDDVEDEDDDEQGAPEGASGAEER
jgi:hypothetical protein